MTELYLAFTPHARQIYPLSQTQASVLISYHYLKDPPATRLLNESGILRHRRWALDSGAFSAKNAGAMVGLHQYIQFCLPLLKSNNPPSMIFSLDVIGDGEATIRNTEAMLKAGVPVIPTYHKGEPLEYLTQMAKDHDKIALGGVARAHGAEVQRFLDVCFNKVYPKKIHGLGLTREKVLQRFPFHSVDSSSWELEPLAFHRWMTMGQTKKNVRMVIRGAENHSRLLCDQVRRYIDRHGLVIHRWAKEMRRLEG